MSATNTTAPVPQLSEHSSQPECVTAPSNEQGAAKPDNQPVIEGAEIAALRAFFQLLDAWDRRLSACEPERKP